MESINNKAVIILGMHRSGTSLLAGVLTMLGVNPGNNLIPASSDNEKGVWEHREIVNIHDQMLDVLGSSWDDIAVLPDNWWVRNDIVPLKLKLKQIIQRDFAQSSVWLVKDPRTCRLLPVWLDIFNEIECQPCFIFCIRHPLEVASSLQKRGEFDRYSAILLWLVYILESERWSRGYNRITVTYESILENWRNVAVQVMERLGINLLYDDPEVIKKITGLVDPQLKHHMLTGDNGVMSNSVYELAINTYHLLTSEPVDEIAGKLNNVYIKLTEIRESVSPMFLRNNKLRHEVIDLRANLTLQQAEVSRVKSSVSWRITKPIRLCEFILRKLRGQM